MELKHLTWDYKQPLEDELWRASRLAEFFPFVLEDLTPQDKVLLLRKIDELNLPAERVEYLNRQAVCPDRSIRPQGLRRSLFCP
jgi:hypothetical protein